jgi:DNA-binding NarL/FixJ family response regulator
MSADLRSVLCGRTGIRIVGRARSGEQCVDLAMRLKPHVVLLDTRMPDVDGLEITRRIVAGNPGTRVVGLSVEPDRSLVTAMLAAGAAGCLAKDCPPGDLMEAIATVSCGRRYLCPGIQKTFGRDSAAGRAGSGGLLSDRQLQSLRLLCEGFTTKEIASCLRITPRMVNQHWRKAMRKLKCTNMAQMVRVAVRAGLL